MFISLLRLRAALAFAALALVLGACSADSATNSAAEQTTEQASDTSTDTSSSTDTSPGTDGGGESESAESTESADTGQAAPPVSLDDSTDPEEFSNDRGFPEPCVLLPAGAVEDVIFEDLSVRRIDQLDTFTTLECVYAGSSGYVSLLISGTAGAATGYLELHAQSLTDQGEPFELVDGVGEMAVRTDGSLEAAKGEYLVALRVDGYPADVDQLLINYALAQLP